MSPDPLDLVWRCSNVKSPCFSGFDIATWPTGVFESLKALGLLREWNTATHAACTACSGEHIEEVTLLEYPDGAVRFFISCLEHGRVEIEKDHLLQWAVDFDPLLECLKTSLSAVGDSIEVVPSRLWSIGRSTLAGRSRLVWVGRGLSWHDAVTFAGEMPTGASPVLFFIGQPPPNGLVALKPDSMIDVAKILSLVEGKLAFDHAAVEDQLSAQRSTQKKKPPKKRASRATAMDSLEQVLIAHIISARDHAYSESQRGSTAELLPRPTQKLLAEQLDLSRSAVSRAFNDSNAHTLRMLWDLADDLERVMQYKGRS